MSKPNLSPAQHEFIEHFVVLVTPRGMPPSVARLYAYLMLCAEPVSLDQMMEDLEIAKSSASVAARLLESAKLVRRHSERGSKRVRYSITEDPAGLLVEQSHSLAKLGELLLSSALAVATGDVAERLQSMSRFYLAMQNIIDEGVRELSADAATSFSSGKKES